MPEPTIAWSEMVGELYPRLHASDEATLRWWTEADLRGWANDAIQLLARTATLFVRRDASVTTGIGTRTYGLPALHLATLHATYDNQPLRATDRALIDALDYAADTALCGAGEVPKRWYEDTLGVHAQIGVYPSPSAARTLAVIFSQQPAVFVNTASTIPIPRALKAYLEDYVLGEAWLHDSDFSMPEIAAHLKDKRGFYSELYRAYWGPRP